MLKFPCLVLDHDDTVVQSESTINYPAFVSALEKLRPGIQPPDLREFAVQCSQKGYSAMCREDYGFTEAEMKVQFDHWFAFAMSHTPPCFPRMKEIIQRQKALGGIICVVSHSARQNILRDYDAHIGIRPDCVYGAELPPEHQKPSPYALEQIRAAYGLDYSEMLVVDDLMPGCRMAKSRNIPFAWAGWSREQIPEIAAPMEKQADYVLNTPSELETLLFGKESLTNVL